jgi:endonuclease-3
MSDQRGGAADSGVQFVDIAEGLNDGVRFGYASSADQKGVPSVADLSVYFHMSIMPKGSDRLKRILSVLKLSYPDADCALDHQTPFQLLAATILSAQCTDERVNRVTPSLFAAYPTAEAMSQADQADVERLIRSTGFFRSKALSLVTASKRIVADFNGEVPRSMAELLTLRGVARKTANVVLGVCYRIAEGVVVDTHVSRLSKRMGMSTGKNPVTIEKDLMKIVPQEDWIWVSHALITHGRKVCKAMSPACDRCALEALCPKTGV